MVLSPLRKAKLRIIKWLLCVLCLNYLWQYKDFLFTYKRNDNRNNLDLLVIFQYLLFESVVRALFIYKH